MDILCYLDRLRCDHVHGTDLVRSNSLLDQWKRNVLAGRTSKMEDVETSIRQLNLLGELLKSSHGSLVKWLHYRLMSIHVLPENTHQSDGSSDYETILCLHIALRIYVAESDVPFYNINILTGCRNAFRLPPALLPIPLQNRFRHHVRSAVVEYGSGGEANMELVSRTLSQ